MNFAMEKTDGRAQRTRPQLGVFADPLSWFAGSLAEHRDAAARQEDRILAMYLRGDSLPAIGGALRAAHGIDTSAESLAALIQDMLSAVRKWQCRALEPHYTMLCFGRLPAKFHGDDCGAAIQTVLGIRADGGKEILGLWAEKAQARLWSAVLRDLKRRGLRDVPLAVPHESRALCGAIAAAFPHCRIAPCPPRTLKSRLELATLDDRAAMQETLQSLCCSADGAVAERTLAAFSESWGIRYPDLARGLRREQGAFAPFFALPASVRGLIAKTDPSASLNEKLKRRNMSLPCRFANETVALLLLSNLLRGVNGDWRVSPSLWKSAQADFAALKDMLCRTSASGQRRLGAEQVRHADQFRQ